ncbi:chloride channel protein 2-like isoform X2 [Brachyhypopomus gauderio]|uniref:chloride channel protein 2-like isoform X2 n=1 Tax=Brachyhypopomus gauderio TaxID=698409 RepID=UPI004042D63A
MTGEAGDKGAQQCQPLMSVCYTDDPEDEGQLKKVGTEQNKSPPGRFGRNKFRFLSPQGEKFLALHVMEDWMILVLLAVITAFLSWAMEYGIELGLHTTLWLFEVAHSNVFLQYLAWVSIPVLLICFSAGFTYLVGPQAAGSGIPEIKTIVKGGMVKDHLSLNTLVAKLVGLTCALGSGMPLGKESPFVHIGGICAVQLNRLATFLGGVKERDSLTPELLVIGSAVGIAACFGSPVGGLLYSIEVASSFLMVKNYWKGYFAATISAFVFRLLPVWSGQFETITPLFHTNYRLEFPYELSELLSFCILGVLSGLASAFLVFLTGTMVRFIRGQSRFAKFLAKTRLVYPALVTFVIATLTFPPGFGQFMAGELTQRETLEAFFDNYTWSTHLTEDHFDHSDHSVAWKHPYVSVFVTLTISVVMKFFMSAVAISMPVPCGAFVPAFVIGAGLGRLVGEVTAVVIPPGVHANATTYAVVPGSYAVAGAAAMSGASTHTISTAMIVFELTGQISYIFPTIFCVFVANMVSQSLQPSLYETLIRIRKLPYPSELSWDHPPKSNVQVKDFMLKDLRYLNLRSTYRYLRDLLLTDNLKTFPLVKSTESMILLGSVERPQLESLLAQQLSHPRVKELGKQTSTDSGEDESQKDSSDKPSFSTKPHKKERGSQDSQVPLKSLACADSAAVVEVDIDEKDTLTTKGVQTVEWEEQQLDEQINFNNCKIDPASIQLMEHTSLPKVINIFSMMGLDQAYVTSVGQLVGLVTRQELYKAIEGVVKVHEITTHPPLTSFRDNRGSRRVTDTPEATELTHLLGDESGPSHRAEPDDQ